MTAIGTPHELLSANQIEAAKQYREFADDVVAPLAAEIDSSQRTPMALVEQLAEAGHLGSMLPEKHGGRGLDRVGYGLFTEEIGRACQNTRNLVAVIDMVAHSIARWGTAAQRERWLPRIVEGRSVAAFALTEPDVGSDAKNITSEARDHGDEIVLSGRKCWISYAQLAEVFLVFVQYQGQHTAVLLERDTPGLKIVPITGLLGLRGSMLGELVLDDVRVPAKSVVGRPGAGLHFVASSALEIGRYSTAWGCVGLEQACLDDTRRYSSTRVQSGVPIRDHQLVQALLADMVADVAAARLLCLSAGLAHTNGSPDTVERTLIAKFFASRAVNRAAADAVQLHGARGIGGELPIQRYFRDARVLEIIEGTTQLHQSMLGRRAVAG